MKAKLILFTLLSSLTLWGLASAQSPKTEGIGPVQNSTPPLRKMHIPDDNPITPEKIKLGKQLFYRYSSRMVANPP